MASEVVGCLSSDLSSGGLITRESQNRIRLEVARLGILDAIVLQ